MYLEQMSCHRKLGRRSLSLLGRSSTRHLPEPHRLSENLCRKSLELRILNLSLLQETRDQRLSHTHLGKIAVGCLSVVCQSLCDCHQFIQTVRRWLMYQFKVWLSIRVQIKGIPSVSLRGSLEATSVFVS